MEKTVRGFWSVARHRASKIATCVSKYDFGNVGADVDCSRRNGTAAGEMVVGEDSRLEKKSEGLLRGMWI